MLMVEPCRYTSRHQKQKSIQAGFTIVEMMMATMVFSVIMLVAAGTVVRFTTNFQRGVIATTTQNTARSVIDTISQSLQLYGDNFSNTATGYCIGSTAYSYVLGRQLRSDGQRHVLVEQKEGLPLGCGTIQNLASNPANPAGQELLSENMRLAQFDITPRNDGLFDLTIRVVYGDDDLLCVAGVNDSSAKDCSSPSPMANVASLSKEELKNLQCKGQKGSQYCAVSEITTTIQRRV